VCKHCADYVCKMDSERFQTWREFRRQYQQQN
jgi:hypothetical protein